MDPPVTLRAPDGRLVDVGRGFSWPAFLLGPFWAAARRAWRLCAWLAIANVALAVLGELALERTLDLSTAIAIQLLFLAFMLWCGARGNAWLVADYERQGFRRVAAARGDDRTRRPGS